MAQANLLTTPSFIPPSTALLLSQKAPPILASPPKSSLPWPLSLIFNRESPETWAIHENLLLSCLRTGDDKSARICLDRMIERFGEENERVMALKGIYEEAVAKNNGELEQVFQRYEKILKADPTNFAIRKRRVAVLKSLGKVSDAITALTVLLQGSPTDAEAWAELSELYASQGMHSQAIYCMEEVLLIIPNAWSAHAQTATLHYLSSQTSSSLPPLTLALRHFARSVELNESYLRGFYGLKLVSSKLISLLPNNAPSKRNTNDDEEVQPPSISTVKKLEELATSKLAEIVRQYSSGKKAWQGFEQAEVIAARELLDRDEKVMR
ncbi:TPR-like protein [Zopfia rhizophila CBS 207.26]|uniref:ER membrane protein complex subunit 2 n=1 Tax=Zopfia rhizophila CBS 207.26 TaxID=1314779 RepID=A0A6A6E3E7_9PEZI|nr:TPR-like protein [Zopfia rhizophila CBS 207.26]